VSTVVVEPAPARTAYRKPCGPPHPSHSLGRDKLCAFRFRLNRSRVPPCFYMS